MLDAVPLPPNQYCSHEYQAVSELLWFLNLPSKYIAKRWRYSSLTYTINKSTVNKVKRPFLVSPTNHTAPPPKKINATVSECKIKQITPEKVIF